MTSQTFTLPYQTVLDGNGNPVSGALAFFYQAGTTTPQDVYTTSDLATAHTNPVVADSSGRLPPIYLNGGLEYRVIIRNSDNNLVYDSDDFNEPITAEEVGRAIYARSDGEISASVTPTSFAYPVGDVRRYGMATTETAANNTTALTRAISVGENLFFPSGDFTVQAFQDPAAGTVWTGDGRIVTSDSHRRTWEYGAVQSTQGDSTYYVDPAGNDANLGTQASPFRTLNRALQQIPQLVRFGDTVTIQLVDGTHSQSDLAVADMTRPAVGYITKSIAQDRSVSITGNDLNGSIVIRGTTQAGTIIQTSANITYGIYAAQSVNVVLENLTIQSDGTNPADALVTANRNSYVHMSDVTLDGDNQADQCLVAEAGGIIEIKGASTLADATNNIVAFEESMVVISGTTVVGAAGTSALAGRGTIKMAGTSSVTGDIEAEGTEILTRGTDTSNRIVFSGAVTLFNGDLQSVFTNFTGATLDLSNTDVQLNVCSWSGQIIMRGGAIRLRSTTTSYVSPATASTVANPLALLGDAQLYMDSNADIAGSGSVNNAIRGVNTQAVAANATNINYQAQSGRIMQTEITANGVYTACPIAPASSDFSQPPNEGDRLTLLYTSGSNSVQVVDSSTAEIVSGAIVLGAGSGEYTSIELAYRSDRIWQEVGRSLVNP